MTNDELNKFILHYLTEDRTHGAIMLTGDWGSGKSYYINNKLKPYIEQLEKCEYKCIAVSLYGINNIGELSKEIYLESRFKFLNSKKEALTSSRIIAKTILKGITSYIGIDLSSDINEMNELYESINLKNKLIIFEDFERAGIDTIELLGYINSLVEQDNVKVLIVANEKEMLEYEQDKENKPKQDNTNYFLFEKKAVVPNYTEKTNKYLKVKEKTVSDTISYDGDYNGAVKGIITSFNNRYLKHMIDDKNIDKLINICKEINLTNFRTLLFACQKTADILDEIKPDISSECDYVDTIFYSIIAFSQKIKSGEKIEWCGGEYISTELSLKRYPLFRSSYDYIVNHKFNGMSVEKEKCTLEKIRKYDRGKSKNDDDLSIIYNWQIQSETNVNNALIRLADRLKNESDISFYEYGNLVDCLVYLKNKIGFEINDIVDQMIINLRNKSSQIESDGIFVSRFFNEDDAEIENEKNLILKKMINSFFAIDESIYSFDYKPDNINSFMDKIDFNKDSIVKSGCFLTKLDLDKINNMLLNCTSEQIQQFRKIFLEMYSDSNIMNLTGDKETLDNLLNKVHLINTLNNFDKIQKIQLDYFESNLGAILQKMQNYIDNDKFCSKIVMQ